MEITAFASPAEAHARVAYALSEVRKYLVPDSNDEIRQGQMREIQIIKKMENKEDLVTRDEEVVTQVSQDSGHESDTSISPGPGTGLCQTEINPSVTICHRHQFRSILHKLHIHTAEDRDILQLGNKQNKIIDKILAKHSGYRIKRDYEER